jgi:hypothetical protein
MKIQFSFSPKNENTFFGLPHLWHDVKVPGDEILQDSRKATGEHGLWQ